VIWKPEIQERDSNQESKKAGKREDMKNDWFDLGVLASKFFSSFPAFLIHLQSAKICEICGRN